MRTISSRHNPVVRAFRDLAGAPAANGARLLLDGPHLVAEARAAGARFEVVAVAATKLDVASEEGDLARRLAAEGVDVVAASDAVFEAMSPVRTPAGIVAIAARPPLAPADVCRRAGLIVAAVDVQDPGNLGALIRAAEAGGADGVLVAGASASPFSWKAIRGSMGSVLRLPVAVIGAPAEAVACMKKLGLRTVAAVARSGGAPDAVDWTGKVGLLLGGEGPGLSPGIVEHADALVTIPMSAPVESLNVAVAGAVLVYAARRQRL